MADPTPSGPPAEVTDPGFKNQNKKVGKDDGVTLPDVVPLISATHTSSVGLFANEFWVRANWLLRGLFGTAVEWMTFFTEAGLQYPKVSVVGLAILSTVYEESYSTNPIMTNTIQYAMESYDPSAAEKIFRPKPIAADPLGDASKKLLTEATADYLKSTAYAELKTEVEQDVQRQIRRQTYAAAGMKEDVAAVDAEIVAACEERKAKRHPVVAEPAPEPEPKQVEPPAPTEPEPPAEAQP
jgi:hypothetical protein